MLIERLKRDQIAARRPDAMRKEGEGSFDPVAAALLPTLYAEAAKVGKDNGNRPSTDAETVGVIRKFLGNAQETIATLEKAGRDASVQRREVDILGGYLPKALEGDDLAQAVEAAIAATGASSKKDMGKVMAHLKQAHGAALDGKAASAAVGARLA